MQSKRKNRMSKEINDVLNSTNDFSGDSSTAAAASFMDVGTVGMDMSMPDIGGIDISI